MHVVSRQVSSPFVTNVLMCAIVHVLCVAQIANWWPSTSWGDNRVAFNGSRVCHGL